MESIAYQLFQSPWSYLTSQKLVRVKPYDAFPVNLQQTPVCSEVFRIQPWSYDTLADSKAGMTSCAIPFLRNQVKIWKLLV